MKQHKLFYGSSYDRGLEHLLRMWPDIKNAYPDAELHIAYGWDLFDKVASNNPERMAWKERMVKLMQQEGITDHGRVSKKELTKIRQQCGIWAYPTHFTEINCITALEAQKDGLVPVTVTLAALEETVQSGIVIDGDIYTPETKARFLDQLIELMGDEDWWTVEHQQALEVGKKYGWDTIAKQWDTAFKDSPQDVKVSVCTLTIRKGFWNIMAHNIANQTYKNIEWVIVDDYPQDRSKIAKEYAKKYNLDIKYLRGKPRKIKRKYGLVNANNTALQHASGDLLVFLQDFILMPEDGVEELVIQHKKNPDCLIAPTDYYVAPKIKPDTTSEDWFHGELDIKGTFIRKNVRIQNLGIRYTDNPYDLEMNYCAIPKKILQHLNGWWEFFDDGLGYDNTEIALRAMMLGYKIVLDESNVACCIDHWEALKGTTENVLGRETNLNDPRYIFLDEMMKLEQIPVIRDAALDNAITLAYEMPAGLDSKQAIDWIDKHGSQIVKQWMEAYQ